MGVDMVWMRLKERLRWRRLMRLVRRGEGRRVLLELRGNEVQRPLSPIEDAIVATLLLQDGQNRAAQEHFSSLRGRLGGVAEPDDLYIRKYASCYLALIRDQREQAAYEAQQASVLMCRPFLRRILPFPQISNRPKLESFVTALA
ncbi:MAG: hypothetical protein ACK5SX_04500 [Sandaracinobacter sp.]